MNETLKAAKLDFYLVKPYIKSFSFSFIITLVYTVIFKSFTFSVLFTVIISTMFIGYPFSISEKNGMERMYGILPISKKHMVIGRYIYTCSTGLLVSLVPPILYSVLLRVLGVTVSLPEICMSAVFGFAIFSFYTVIQLPGYYKYGALKGRAFMYIPLIAYIVLAYVLLRFEVVSEWFFTFIIENPIVIGIAVLLVCIVAYWISIVASIRALQNKEM